MFLLRQQLLLGFRQPAGLLLQLTGLRLRLAEQLLCAQVALQDFKAHRHQRQQFADERLLPGVERAKRRHFDDAQQRVLGQER